MDKINYLFVSLKEYLQEKSEFSPSLVQRSDTSTYPKVVFKWEMDRNNFLGNTNRDTLELFTITLNIYAKDTDTSDSIYIAEELQRLCYEFFTMREGMKLSFSSPTPNIDESIYRITMKFAYYGSFI